MLDIVELCTVYKYTVSGVDETTGPEEEMMLIFNVASVVTCGSARWLSYMRVYETHRRVH